MVHLAEVERTEIPATTAKYSKTENGSRAILPNCACGTQFVVRGLEIERIRGPTNEAHVPWETNPSQLAFGFYRFQKLNRTDIYVFLNWDVPVPVFKNCCR